MLHSSVSRTVAAAGLLLLAIPAAVIDGGAIAIAQPMSPAPSAPPAASDSRPATTQPARPGVVDANIRNAQMILADLKATFQAGRVEAESGPGAGPDNRMALLCLLVTQKIPYMIHKRIEDAPDREAALAEARELGEYVDNTLVPAFTKARQSRRPEDARGLVALMDELDGHLTGMQKVVSAASSAAAAAPPAPGPQQGGLPGAMSSASNSPAAGRVPPRVAAPEPLDAWTRYVQQFVTTYNLNSMQQQQAWPILKDLKDRAQEYRISHKPDYDVVEKGTDKTQHARQLQALDAPIDQMFEELKTRLMTIPTEAQRNAVAPGSSRAMPTDTRPAGRGPHH